MHMRPNALRSLLAWILIFPLAAFPDTGGKLERFEKDATLPRSTVEPPDPPPPTRSYEPAKIDESDDADIVTDLIIMVPMAMAAGGVYSWQRIAPPTIDDSTNKKAVTPRAVGEGVIPYARVDGSYNRVGDDIHAADTRVEIGYGPFGFEVRQMHYTESDPDTVLDVKQYHALYRMSAGKYVEIDLGYGRLDLVGVSHNSGGSWTLPILIHPSTRFGIEYRPSWASINGNSVSDQELAISLGDRFWAVRGGYHWLESPADRLSGPFIGLSLRL